MIMRKAWPAPFVSALAVLALAGCAQRGDFGRQQPNVVHDQLMPLIGVASTFANGQDATLYNFTNDERTLRDLGWGLVVPNHSEDWLGRSAAQLQRSEIIHELDFHVRPEAYHLILTLHRYRSSDARYARIMDDAARDMAAIAPYMEYAVRVRDADRQRRVAAQSLPDIAEYEVMFVNGRIEQNQRQMAWVKRAMLFRLYAYRYAVDRLMIETPSRLAGATIERLNAMEELILSEINVDLHVPRIRNPYDEVDLMDIVTKG